MRKVLLIALVFCGHTGFGQYAFIYKGNKFGMSAASTATVVDPITNKEEFVAVPARPVSINGARIYDANLLSELVGYETTPGMAQKLSTYIYEALKSDLEKLDDGEYILKISDAVIDSAGYLVYYKFDGIQKLTSHHVASSKQDRASAGQYGPMEKKTAGKVDVPAAKKNDADHKTPIARIEKTASDSHIPVAEKNGINQKSQDILDHLKKMMPGKKDGHCVSCTGELFNNGSCIVIRDHKATFNPGYFNL